jgi:beta-lactamase class A
MRITAILALILAASAPAQQLSDALRARIAGFPGTVTLYARNLDTGASIGIRETDPVRTASTIKLPILCAVFDAVARGQAKWTEPLTVAAAEKVSGSGVIGTELSDGVQLPLSDVVHLMIVLSDNTATNMVLERFTADAVNAYLDKIGIRTTRSMRKVRGDGNQLKSPSGFSAAGKLPENEKYGLGVSTPRDMVTILEKLDRGEIVSPEASREIVAILKRCQDSNGIRRRLSDFTIANKTGSLDALRSDLGIVYTKTARIALAITVDGIPKPDWTPDNPGSLLIADLAKLIVDGLAAAPPAPSKQ